MNILTVDFTADDAAQQFVESLHNTGFAVIKNHSIDIETINNVYRDWQGFFASDEKNDYLYDKETLDGYCPMDISETAKGYEIKDIKEYYHYYAWGRKPKNIGPATHQLLDQMGEMAQTLLSWIEQETPDEISAKFSMPLSDMITDSPRTVQRILHYPPFTGSEEAGAVRAAEHQDIDLITLLPAATDSGLQIKDKNGQWHDLPCDFGNIAVNIGDMLQEASGHYFPSTAHRVINPTGAATERSRLSLPLFLHPRDEVRLSDRYTAFEYWRERIAELGLE